MLQLLIAVSTFSFAFSMHVNNVCSNLFSYPFSFISRNCYYNSDVFSDVLSMAKKHGFYAEDLNVTTEDGYILTVYRINLNKIQTTKGSIFVQHGLAESCTPWVDQSKQSLAFYLANNGYDVFLGNFRGSRYSPKHIKYNVHNPKFWNFTVDTIAEYDLPAMLGLVAVKSKSNKKIIYIGHSMGTTSVFMLASRFPKKAQRMISVIIALAPVVYLSGVFKLLSYPLIPIIDLLLFLNIRGIFYQQRNVQTISTTLTRFLPLLMRSAINVLFGSTNQFPPEKLLLFWSYYPSGASLYQIKQFLQFANQGKFQMYDFGKIKNFKRYGTKFPPQYDLSNVKIPTHLFYALNDRLAQVVNVKKLYVALSNSSRSLHNVEGNNTALKVNHINFLYSNNNVKDIYARILETLS